MNSSQLDKPLLNLRSTAFACTEPGCDKIFATKFSLKRHNTVHSNYKPFLCRNCGKKFGLAQNLREHSFSHTKERPYICGINGCTRSFRHPSELSLHRRTHPEYKLRKYQYLTLRGKAGSETPRKFAILSVPVTSHSQANQKEEKAVCKDGSECSSTTTLKTGPYDFPQVNLEIDMKYIEYLKNITFPQEERPKLPLSGRGAFCSDKNFVAYTK
eukprot:TRINITY_DN348_c0_g1_i4.p1 TRINITY_DN348_c0_g1~~TRINITY_DN348_c0_g1_i4.p1  ORF type:complete len:214 (+),score=41.74 TRINITY_DN348_c0_g1_i4:213-854(+)